MSKKETKTSAVGYTITPNHKLFDLHLGELWRYKDLIGLFVKRDFVAKYKQTILGPLWAVFQPLLTTIVFTFIFGSLAGLSQFDTQEMADMSAAGELAIPGFLFYMSGTICWTYFSGCLTGTSNTFIGGSGIMGKVYFPRLVMPISTVCSGLISFAIQFAMFVIIWAVYLIIGGTGMLITPMLFIVPLLILQMALLGMGFGIIISSLTTKYRDLTMLVGFGVQLWQYATPVAYGLTLITASETFAPYSWIYMLNPMTPIITSFRYAFFGVGYFDINYYLISWAVTLLILFIGLLMFTKIERTFMDTI